MAGVRLDTSPSLLGDGVVGVGLRVRGDRMCSVCACNPPFPPPPKKKERTKEETKKPQKEAVKYWVQAPGCTEAKMREAVKLGELRIKAIQEALGV